MVTPVSSFSILPNELILEIFKYLSKVDIFFSFDGIHQRFHECIINHCHHISLTDLAFEKFNWICQTIIPKFGSQIRSLLLSDCRSVLQGKIFIQYFSSCMSETFPNLERLKLMCFTADELDIFLKTITDLPHFREIIVVDLLTDQPDLLEIVARTNQNRFHSIHLEANSPNLPSSPCLNVQNLRISIPTLDKLFTLLSVLPNIQQLNVTVPEISMLLASFTELSPLVFLKTFFLRCYHHFWILDEIESLLLKLPAIEYLSLQISSQDDTFVDSEQKLFQILPKTLIQFNLSLRYYYATIEEIDQVSLKKSPFPILCLIDETLQQAVLHTIPCRFPCLNISLPMSKQMSNYQNYQHVEMFYDNHGMTLAEALPIISNCHRVDEIALQCYEKAEEPPSVPLPFPSSFPNLIHLTCLWFSHSSREYQSLKFLLQASPNLSQLFIAFDNLSPVFNDPEACQLLAQRIVHLLILRPTPATPTHLTEEHIPYLHRIFTRVRHLQIDITKGPSIETIILSIMSIFQEQMTLISLVVEGETKSDELKSNARQWIVNHTYLTADGKFDAEFVEKTNRFLLWL